MNRPTATCGALAAACAAGRSRATAVATPTAGCVLFLCMPRDPRTSPWYGDLLACLVHVGIVWAWAPCGDPALATKLEVFRPTVVISTDSLAVLESSQPEVIAAYKRAHGCLRVNALRTPHGDETG